MSKRNRSFGTAEERSESNPSSDAVMTGESGMGKEIKISLAVITVLLGGMGYALYRQFAPAGGNLLTPDQATESTDSPGSASSTDTEQGQKTAESTSPTIVAATPGASDGTGMASTSTLTNPWATASSGTASQGRDATRTGSAGFSYMPQAVPAAPTGRYATGYGSETSEAAASDSRSADQRTGSTQPQYDSYRTYASQSTTPAYPSNSTASAGRQDSLLSQYGAGTSGASAQSSASYGANRGSHYGTSSSYGPPSSLATTPGTSSASAYPDNSTSAYADDSPSAYGSSATASTSGQDSFGQSNFGQSSFSQGSFPEKDVIQTQPQQGKYLIQPNDSYWTISKRLYGTGAYFRALAEHNRKNNPDTHQLRVADEIETPSASTLEATYPTLCPTPSHREAIQHRASVAGTTAQPSGSNVYTVQAGDTLFDIARYELGKASRWVEIYQLNRERLGKNFDYLTPGLQLALPSDQQTETVTQQPAASFRR